MSINVIELLEEPKMTTVCAPMVRYSKLQFRTLVRRYGCDITFTPMILADSFVQSAKARNNEFTTHKGDEPLIVQFAAKRVDDFLTATEMISPYCNGVDLNCGCPQRWAMKDGYGADLLSKPQLVKDLISAVRNRINKPFTVSVKIRLLKDIRKTIDFCKTLEKAGVSFITIHARTPQMRTEPIDMENLKLVKDSIRVPLIANGDVKNLEDAKKLYESINCNGVMAARGLLTNPALFAGFNSTPLSCVQDWLDITANIETPFLCMHHHLVFMLEKIMPKKERLIFNNLQNNESVINFLEEHYQIKPNCDMDSEDMNTIFCDFKEPVDKYWVKKESDFVYDNNCNDNFFGNIFSE